MKQTIKTPKKEPEIPKRPKLSGQMIIWMVIFIFLAILFWQTISPQSEAKISYTEFKKQVEKGNVTEITINQQEISGKFKKPYEVSQAKGGKKTSYSTFATIKPSIEDPGLITSLEEHNVNINAKKKGSSWLGTVLILVLPWVLIIGYFVFMQRKMGKQMQGLGQGGIFGIGKSRAKRFRKSMSEVTYQDVAGLENAKTDLREIVDYLKEPEKFKKIGADIPKGILLVGPPGTGKTLLARATAGEANVPFFSISGSEFIEMFVGVGASRVRDMFDMAKREAPSIIFIDELDSVGRARGTGLGGGHDEREQTLNQILSEMDGFVPHQSVIVLSSTNRPDVLDPALTRPGRFDRQITLGLPHKEARRKILLIHTRHVPLEDDVDLGNISSRTVGFSGADLKNLVNEAALLAARGHKEKVSSEEFDKARDKILLGYEREEIMSEDEKKITAYHEAGHALMAVLTPGADPLQKVTIIPRGMALGATEQAPTEDRHSFKREYLLKRISIMLGGRAAEKLVFSDISNGASDDLKQVTKLARRMVTQWGMSDKIGPVTFSLGEEHLFLGREMAKPREFSEETAGLIDEEIQRIMIDQEKEAIETIGKNRSKLDTLAKALLEHETLEKKDIELLLKKKNRPETRRRKERARPVVDSQKASTP
jgi:cell division protease FtsH